MAARLGAGQVSRRRIISGKALQLAARSIPMVGGCRTRVMTAAIRPFGVALLACTLGSASAQIVPKQIELGDFGKCLFKQAPRESTKLLRTELDSLQERDLARTLARGHGSCIRGPVLSGRSGAIRGAVAQAALFANTALLDTLARHPTAAPLRPPMADGRRFLIEYAQCLVAADPPHTAAFLRTPYSSDAEQGAFLDYGETLKACMPLGEQYRVDIPDIRNQIAAIAWQTATASVAS